MNFYIFDPFDWFEVGIAICGYFIYECILFTLMGRYPSLRVAYIDEVEETSDEKTKKVVDRVSYYSVLVKAVPKSGDSSDPVQNQDQVQVLILFRGTIDA